jgi:hypothetical protein
MAVILCVSEERHLAWLKIASMLGLGCAAVRLVRVDPDLRLDTAALQETDRSDGADGRPRSSSSSPGRRHHCPRSDRPASRNRGDCGHGGIASARRCGMGRGSGAVQPVEAAIAEQTFKCVRSYDG